MKKHKKILFALISAVMIFSTIGINTALANNYAILKDDTVSAKVIQIIDGDAIKVQVLDTNETALVKIVGVDAKGYDGSVKYLTDKILGAVVTLSKDANINIVSGNWNYRYVIYGGVNISNELVSKGYAALDTNQSNGSLYSFLTDTERAARATQMELWGYGTNSNNTVVGNGYAVNRNASGLATDMVNINTATAYQLKSHLEGVNEMVAQNIVKYRNSNPFNDKYEIMYVSGFTSEMFQANKEIMNVSTNVVTASVEELETLNISDDEVDKIVSFRNKSIFEDIYDVKRKNLIGEKKYDSIKSYISCVNTDTVDQTVSNYVINFNTADEQQLKSVGLNNGDVKKILDHRVNGYTMKNLMELKFIDGFSLTDDQLYAYEDNLHSLTNINTAKDSELRSMFNSTQITKIKNSSMFNSLSDVSERLGSDKREKIKGAVYFTRKNTSYVNINTATASQIELTGLSYERAKHLVGNAPMKCAEDIPFNIADYDDKITLYTNLNTASQAELKTLNNGVTDALISDIMSYRSQQPFGDYDDVRKFFLSRNASNVYNAIKDYIVLR